MENPLWHRSLKIEDGLANRIRHSPSTGVRLAKSETNDIIDLLMEMRKQLPPA